MTVIILGQRASERVLALARGDSGEVWAGPRGRRRREP